MFNKPASDDFKTLLKKEIKIEAVCLYGQGCYDIWST
jgi:hypothetical protein